jgi:hypothetical protein
VPISWAITSCSAPSASIRPRSAVSKDMIPFAGRNAASPAAWAGRGWSRPARGSCPDRRWRRPGRGRAGRRPPRRPPARRAGHRRCPWPSGRRRRRTRSAARRSARRRSGPRW